MQLCTMWLISSLVIGALISNVHAQDCVTCLTQSCQSTLSSFSGMWASCQPCLTMCTSLQSADCYNTYFSPSQTNTLAQCCSLITSKLMTLVQNYRPALALNCSATPPFSSPVSPQTSGAPLPYVSSNGQPLQYIIPQMNFSCQGCLQMLNITLMGGVSADSSFYLQLWRRYTAISGQSSVSSDLYQLNTSVLLTISALAVSSSNVYSLAINVCFHEGDTIGIQLPYNSSLRIATDNSSTTYVRQIPSTCTDNFNFNGTFQPSTNLTGRPLIALVTVPTPTPSLSTSLATPPLGSSLQYILPSSTASLGGTVQPTSTVVPYESSQDSQPPILLIAGASTGAGVLLLVVLIAALVVALIVCRRRKNKGPDHVDGNEVQNVEEISFKTFESGKHPKSRREQTTFRTEDGQSVKYDVPRQSELFSSHEVRQAGSTSRSSLSLTTDSIGPCSLAPQSPEPQPSEALSSLNLPSNLMTPSPSHRDQPVDLPNEYPPTSPHRHDIAMGTARARDDVYDNPRELDTARRPHLYHTLEDPSKELPPRPLNPLFHTLDQTGSSIDETKVTTTTLSSDDDTSLGSSLLSFDVTAPSHQQKANIYHVLETTERDPVTGNRYHVLEEQLRAQNDESPKYGVCVPNARQRKHILKHGEKQWSQVSRAHIQKEKKFFNDNGQFWQPASNDVMLYEQLSKHRFREILRDDIIVGDQLGSGAFGTVYKAQWSFPGGKLAVAVKVMKPSIAEGAKVRFLQEAAVMGQFFHPNVVKLHGVVTVGDPPMIVLELMPRGDLSSFLRNYHTPGERPPPTPTFLLLCSRDIACGMKYLSYKGFVHKDLAARNILLTEDLKCKICDFGLLDDTPENMGISPLKWSAPEAIMDGKFSTSSDVYSYGMLLYEIWSCGSRPLANYGPEKAKRLVQEGYCQPPPPGCPRGIYEVMVKCWNPQHSYRPSFAEIQEYLSASDDTILAWSSSDREVSPQASVLGAPLSEGAGLYKDLQQTYRQLQITA